ncbi:MAG: DNA polymerase I [Elusimicrobia bacterium]|nr:DNA polymerase I [Elusimicrobiota bacterium]
MKKQTLSVDRQRFYLVDAHAYLHRSHAAISGLATHSGLQTGALYGFARMLLGILKQEKPKYLCVCFDTSGPTFRHKEFQEYKAQRPELEEGLKSQLTLARQMVEALGISFLEAGGYEADDLMATLAHRAVSELEDLDVVLVSPDKDILQLLGPRVYAMRELKGDWLDASRVQEKYKVSPERLVDFFALVGDAVDNIPGAPGIGPVRAAELLSRHGSLETILKSAQDPKTDLPAKLAQNLRDSEERLRLNLRLLALEYKVPVSLKLQDCIVQSPKRDQVLDLFRRLEFFSLLKDVLGEGKNGASSESMPVQEIISHLQKAQVFSVAVSHSGMAVGLPGGKAAWVEWSDLSRIASFLSDSQRTKLGHDLKSGILILREKGVILSGPVRDTSLASYCLNPSRAKYTFEDVFLESVGQQAPVGESSQALLFQAQRVWLLWEKLEKDLKGGDLQRLYEQLEIPLLSILADMEWEGIGVEEGVLKALSVEFEERIQRSKKELDDLAGMPINLNSPKQLSFLLFEKLKLPVVRKTKTGYSTDEEVLRTLSSRHPIPEKIIEYRELAKLKSTYIDNLLADRSSKTGRVHTRFNQTGTATGRLSSVQPNLQNIPIRTVTGQKIRRAFIPREGTLFLSADYSQIDLRVLAHITGDPVLQHAFETETDIHLQTACEVFHLKPGEVDSEVRRKAKAINFGVVYGQTPHGLSQELGISYEEAQAYIRKYFEKYAGVAHWIEENLKQAREQGCVRTILGRIRYLPELKSPNTAIRNFAERAAVNTPIQGSSADIIKKAMINIHSKLSTLNSPLSTRMILQVHDDLLFEVPKKDIPEVSSWVKSEMEGAVRLSVPVKVDLKVGSNWQEMTKI